MNISPEAYYFNVTILYYIIGQYLLITIHFSGLFSGYISQEIYISIMRQYGVGSSKFDDEGTPWDLICFSK